MNAPELYKPDTLVEDIANLICESSGQEYSERMRLRVEAKVKRRFTELGLQNVQEYTTYFQIHEKAEFKILLATLTTQATQFFGEYAHFEYISDHYLKSLIPEIRKRTDKTLQVWSAACGRGQEAYSLAMFLKYALSAYGDDLKVRVVGTDSDSDTLKIAHAGMYPRVDFRDIPLQFLGNDWERAANGGAEMMRAKPSLKKFVHFEYANLLGLKAKFPGQKFDLIFTRNVFNTFNESQIRESTLEILTHLMPDGRFFIGMSESLDRLNLPVEGCGPSIYAFQGNAAKQAQGQSAESVSDSASKDLIKVFCVDDSPAVQTLMRHILKKEDGFRIVGTAMSVAEAVRQAQALREADLMTLNLQMRDENGAFYLERNFNDAHPPILIVTAESKDHSDLIQKALKLGEFEFVEKPILNQLAEHSETVRAKLRTLYLERLNNVRSFRGADQFKRASKISKPEEKVRVLCGGMSHLRKITNYLRELEGPQPPTFLFFEGLESNLASIADAVQRASGKPCQAIPAETQTLGRVNEIWVGDFKGDFRRQAQLHEQQKTSLGVFGDVGKFSSELILSWSGARLILEDLGNGCAAEALKPHAAEIFPASSFAFLSSEYLK